MYLGGQKRFYDAVRGELASGRSAESLLKIADKMAAKAGELKGTALKDIIKSALLLVGAGAKEAYERHQVNDYYKEIKAAYDSGKDYELSPDVNIAANPLAQAGLTVASSLGNPVEKSISDYAKGRYTSDRAEEARYQVLYDKIGELERNGTYTKVEAESERKTLAANKPWNLEGTVARTFTPAIGNFVKWKGGEIIRDVTAPQDYVKIADDPGDPSVVERDADTFKTADGRRVRYKGIDATEIAHTAKAGSVDEPFARAAAERVKELAPDGSYVRIKKDTKNPDQDKDAYGRELRYVERLRGPQVVTDVVAKIPGLRNIWPAEDVQKTLVTEGLAKPAYESLDPSRHERAGEYHQASVAAMQRAVGLNSPEGIGTQKSQWWNPQGAKVVDGKWQIPEQPQGLNPAYGAGLMISGQSGIPGKAGAIGSGFMQSYNALLATLGTADIAKRGPKNAKGKKLPRPALYKQAEDQEMEKRIERRRTRRK